MKGCLKHSSPLASPDPVGPSKLCKRKAKMVVFCPSRLEEVHIADEWDRTPTEPARKLTYQDMLELKEIQRSLPRANQPPDPLARRQPAHYLSNVPIGLLPLLPESDPPSRTNSGASSPIPASTPSDAHCASQPSLTDHTCPPPSSAEEEDYTTKGRKGDNDSLVVKPGMLFPFGIPGSQPRSASPLSQSSSPRLPSHLAGQSSQLAHLLPKRTSITNARPQFAFLPLLDTPPSSASSSCMSSTVASPRESPFPSVPSSPSTAPVLVIDELENERDYTDTSASASPDVEPFSQSESNPPHLELSEATSARDAAQVCLASNPPQKDEEHPTGLPHGKLDDPVTTPAADMTHDLEPPTPPLTNASLDSSPHSHVSSLSPEQEDLTVEQVHGSYFPLQTKYHVPVLDDSKDITELDINFDEYFAQQAQSQGRRRFSDNTPIPRPATARLLAIPSPALLPPSPLVLSNGSVTVSHTQTSLLLSGGGSEDRIVATQSNRVDMLVHSPPLRRRVPLAMAFLPVGNATIPESISPSLCTSQAPSPASTVDAKPPAPKNKPRRKKRTFILINDEEVEVPGDESETDSEAETEIPIIVPPSQESSSSPEEAPSIPLHTPVASKSPVSSAVSASTPSLPSPVPTPSPTPPPQVRVRDVAIDADRAHTPTPSSPHLMPATVSSFLPLTRPDQDLGLPSLPPIPIQHVNAQTQTPPLPAPSIPQPTLSAQDSILSSPERTSSLASSPIPASTTTSTDVNTSTTKAKASQQATPPPSVPGSPRLLAADAVDGALGASNSVNSPRREGECVSAPQSPGRRREKERRRRSGSVGSAAAAVGGGLGAKCAIPAAKSAVVRAPVSSA